MDITLMVKTAKTEKILDAAQQLLNAEGDYGLTMRQVALKTGMSLSNVQYYFKTRDDLLKALADRYFAGCLEELRALEIARSQDPSPRDLETLILIFLKHGWELSEMCRIFREYWAISTRNPAIDSYVKDYYREVASVLEAKLRPMASTDRGLSRAISLFIPYAEGYSITATAMPADMDTMAKTLADIMFELLQEQTQG
ncbi:MAG: TetR/AcrR family transcriptional regulator [Pseudomonadota bacterium]